MAKKTFGTQTAYVKRYGDKNQPIADRIKNHKSKGRCPFFTLSDKNKRILTKAGFKITPVDETDVRYTVSWKF